MYMVSLFDLFHSRTIFKMLAFEQSAEKWPFSARPAEWVVRQFRPPHWPRACIRYIAERDVGCWLYCSTPCNDRLFLKFIFRYWRRTRTLDTGIRLLVIIALWRMDDAIIQTSMSDVYSRMVSGIAKCLRSIWFWLGHAGCWLFAVINPTLSAEAVPRSNGFSNGTGGCKFN